MFVKGRHSSPYVFNWHGSYTFAGAHKYHLFSFSIEIMNCEYLSINNIYLSAKGLDTNEYPKSYNLTHDFYLDSMNRPCDNSTILKTSSGWNFSKIVFFNISYNGAYVERHYPIDRMMFYAENDMQVGYTVFNPSTFADGDILEAYMTLIGNYYN